MNIGDFIALGVFWSIIYFLIFMLYVGFRAWVVGVIEQENKETNRYLIAVSNRVYSLEDINKKRKKNGK